MDRNYREDELNSLKIQQLKDIAKNRGLKSSGLKYKLVQRILQNQVTSQPNLSAQKTSSSVGQKIKSLRSEKESNPKSIIQESSLLSLPKDVQKEALLKLDYPEIIKICKTSKQLGEICNDERFWKLYCENRKLTKNLPTDTWKQTAILSYLGKDNYDDEDRFLGNLSWDISVIPKNTPGQDRPDIEINRKNKSPPGVSPTPNLPKELQGIAVAEIWWDSLIPLTAKDFRKIVFRGPVEIEVPDYSIIRRESIESESDLKMPESKVFTLHPDTPVGSTLGHVLEEIYRHIYGLRDNEKLMSIAELSIYPDFYISHSYWEGMTLDPSNTYYRVDLGS